MAKVAIQGGVKNYLGNQKTVNGIPIKWQSGPDAPDTELAYITKAEKNLLLKKDLHGSLKNGPNTGPAGIISLDSQGSGFGGPGPGTGGTGPGPQGDFRSNAQHTKSKADYSRDRTVRGDVSAFKDTGTGNYELSKDPKDQQAVNDYVRGKMAYQKGKKPSFFGAPGSLKQRQQVYDKQRALGWAAKQRARKIKGIDDLIAETYVANPHMDIAEIRDALMSQYDSKNKTMTGLEGFNKASINSITPTSLYGGKIDINKNIGMNYGPTQLGPLGLKTTNVKGEPMSTDYLSTTPSLDSRLNAPGILGFAINKLQGKTSVNNLMSSIDRINQIDTMVDKGITQADINDYYDRAQGKGKYDIFGGGGDGDGPQSYLPFNYNTGAASIEDIEPYTNDFTYRFGTGQNVGADVLRGYVANGGRITRAGGGIMNAVPRQGYFLGGIGKAIKGVVGGVADAAKKVLGSDVGKMALLAAGTYYAGGGNLFGMQRAGMQGFKFGQIPGAKFLMGGGKDGKYLDKFNPLKVGAFGLGALSLFGNKAAPNEDIGMADRGGRLIDPLTGEEGTPSSMRANIENAKIEAGGDPVKLASLNQKYNNMLFSILPYENYGTYAQGGRIRAQEGGLMNLGGMEKDYRAEGGFVPIGKQEKADDVPARLSVNEFVFTADAVRNAGGGDIDKGAEVMENMMKNLENGGRVSEESQGNAGAQEMFSVSERIGEVI